MSPARRVIYHDIAVDLTRPHVRVLHEIRQRGSCRSLVDIHEKVGSPFVVESLNMKIRNTPTEFGVISKVLHWLIAIVMISLIAIGWYTSGLDDETLLYWRMLDLHITLGLSMFMLFLIKATWMMFNPSPDFVPGLASWERAAARMIHGFFVIAMALIPLAGFMYTASDGESINLYDLVEIPDIGSYSKSVRNILYDVHMYAAYSSAALIVVHIMAALKHHFIDMNDTLRRITTK